MCVCLSVWRQEGVCEDAGLCVYVKRKKKSLIKLILGEYK